MINIRFKSNIDFTGETGVYKTSVGQVFAKEGRIVKLNAPSLVILDNWKGQNNDIQKVIWNGYFLELNLSESQIHLINVILACREVTIEDTESKISIDVDTSNSEYFISEFIEFVGQSTYQTILLRFRGDKKVINLQTPTAQTYYIKVGTTYYYTDMSPMLTANIPKIETVEGNDAKNVTVSSDNKQIMSLIFYTDEATKNNIIDDMGNEDVSSITVYDGTTLWPVLENVPLTADILGEDLYKLIVPCVIDSKRFYTD